ncbi:cadherin domain-containing protein, partial [Bradyrhizobium sp.]|uniref:cadherin domain-containing protein n=1 Tax=Bradyrhizobium sp. TaxID=376 RepID=UPI002E071214|nr:cadherin domain-containing protein [Bradyrhizobium sp.]
RAHQNSPSNIKPVPALDAEGNPVPMVSVAEQLVTMSGDLAVAQDYENYLNNREAINALMAANPESAFTAGWIAAFARVNDLKLNQVNASDFLGGLAGWLDSVGKAGLWSAAANATVKRGADNSVIVEVKIAGGTEVPGALSVFADHINVSNNAGGQTVQFTVDSGLGASGYHFLGAGATGGDGGNDFWIGTNASTVFIGSGGHDILTGGISNDSIGGGAGWDFIDGNGGEDWLYGQAGGDILRGGRGPDFLFGGQGDDTYAFARGDGVDVVQDHFETLVQDAQGSGPASTPTFSIQAVNAGTDTLAFGAGIAVSDIVVRASSDNKHLVVGVKDPAHPGVPFEQLADSITLQNWINDPNDRIELLRFADGTTLNIAAAFAAYQVPFGESLSRSSVVEKSAIGTVVGTVTGFDFNSNAALSYSLLNPDGRFAINASTGVLSVAGAISYDDTHALQVTVRAADQTGTGFNQTFTIGVIDVPNRAPVLSVPAGNMTAIAGQPLQVSSWFSATDADNDALTYYFQDGTTTPGSGQFVLNGTPLGQGATFGVSAAQLAGLTFAAGAEGLADDVTMQLSDGHAVSAVGAFHIGVNRAPVLNATAGAMTALAGQPLQVSSWFNAGDADNDALTYFFQDGTATPGSGQFVLNGTALGQGATFGVSAAQLAGLIFVAGAEGLADDVTMQLSDGRATSGVGTFHVGVNRAPTDATLSGNTVAENSPNATYVGKITGVDADAGSVLTYSLLDDAGGRFWIYQASGEIVVVDPRLLDYEAARSHTVTVRTTDQAGLALDSNWSIAVTNVNEAPIDATLSGNSVKENSSNATYVGKVTGLDPDAGSVLTDSLTDDAGGRFWIYPATGEIVVVTPLLLDYEAARSHNITVRIADQAGLTLDTNWSISVTDVDEAPTGATLSGNSVAENSPNATYVGKITGIDPDAGSVLTYSLLDDAGGRFWIYQASGDFVVVDPRLLDYEAARSHTIVARIADQAGHVFDKAFTINLTDVNEAPTGAVLSGGVVAENSPDGAVVATVTGADPDAATVFNYALTNNAGGRFAINAATGVVTVANAALLEYETATSHQISVRSTDQGGLWFEKSWTINVGNANEAPTDAKLLGGTVREHAVNGSHVGAVIGADPDAASVLSYSLTSDAGGRFDINASTGVVAVKNTTLLDYATKVTGIDPDANTTFRYSPSWNAARWSERSPTGNRRMAARRRVRASEWRRAKGATASMACIRKRFA